MEKPSLTCSMSQQQSNRFQASYRCKHLVEVNPLALDVPLGDKTSLVLGDFAGGVALDLEYPL
jgi:hypothetical protein